MPFGFPVATPRITTGNVRTTYDLVTTSMGSVGGYMSSPTFNQYGLANPLGTTFLDVGGADSVSGTTTQLPTGCAALYKYVLYKSTTNPALVARPSAVYYTDNTGTVVSGTMADGVTATISDVAGILMPNTTDLSSLTATILNNGGNGSGVWICIGGFCKGVNAPASTAVGDLIFGKTGNFSLDRVGVTATPGSIILGPLVATALTAVASNASDMYIKLSPAF